MVKDFTKEDIPVLGRLVSISEDNIIANAEQIWDAKNGQSIQDTVNDFDNRITAIGSYGGLSVEEKNVLNFFLNQTSLGTIDLDDLGEDYVELNHFTIDAWYVWYWLNNCPVTIQYAVKSGGESAVSIHAYTNYDADPDAKVKALQLSGGADLNGLVTIGNINYWNYYDNRENLGFVVQPNSRFLSELEVDGPIIAQSNIIAEAGMAVESLAVGQDTPPGGTAIFIVNGGSYFEESAFFNNGFQCDSVCTFNDEIHTTEYAELYMRANKIYIEYENSQFYSLAEALRPVIINEGDPVDWQYLTKQFDHGCPIYIKFTGGQIVEAQSITLDTNNELRYIDGNNSSIQVECNRYNSSVNNGWSRTDLVDNWATVAYVNDRINTVNNNIDTKQSILTAGSGIQIENNVISCTVTGGGQTQGVIDPYYVHTDNNFTNAEQSKLAGIAAGAEVNVQSDWEESNSSSDAYILHKPEYLASFATLVNALTTDGHFVTQNDIITVGGITSQDIQTWNNKADAATTLSGYNIVYDQAVFEEDENDVFTLNTQYKTDHPVRMTSGDDQWTTDGDNKVPTVAAVYDKFLAKDDSTVVKTTGNQTIGGTKTFSVAPIVPGIKSSGSNTQASNKVFTTNGSISTLKTINNTTLFGSGNIDTTYSDFTAPTNNVAGVAGLVPAPAAGKQNYILGATGWVNPSLLVEDDVTVTITPTDANIRMIMTLAANMSETMYNAAYRLNTGGFTFTIDGQQYSYNQISQMKRSKFKFEFSDNFAYNSDTQYGFAITSHKFIPYDHSDMLVIYAIRDDDEAFVFGFASATFMFGALGPDLQYNKLKIKYNATDNNNRLFSVLSEFYQVLGMKSDIVDLVSHKLIYDATPVIAGLQYAGDNIAFHGLIGSTNMTHDTTGLSFSARPEYGLIEYRNGVLVV